MQDLSIVHARMSHNLEQLEAFVEDLEFRSEMWRLSALHLDQEVRALREQVRELEGR